MCGLIRETGTPAAAATDEDEGVVCDATASCASAASTHEDDTDGQFRSSSSSLSSSPTAKSCVSATVPHPERGYEFTSASDRHVVKVI